MISDKSLYTAFKEGDLSSFEEIVIRHRHSLVYFLIQYVNTYENAEDIAQEVFAYIYLNPDQYNDEYSLKTYIFMIGKRRAIDMIRKLSKYQIVELEETLVTDRLSLDDHIFKEEQLATLRAYINQLKPSDREVITLIDLNGFSLKEAAFILKKSVTATKVLSHRAKKRLKQKMIEGGFTYEV